MRNPDRLHMFYDEIKRIHIQYFSDYRFGQFVLNFLSNIETDPYYWEEEKFLEEIKKYVGELPV